MPLKKIFNCDRCKLEFSMAKKSGKLTYRMHHLNKIVKLCPKCTEGFDAIVRDIKIEVNEIYKSALTRYLHEKKGEQNGTRESNTV